MGEVIDTGIKGFGLEERNESYYIYELKNKKEHIFISGDDGFVEISKEFLDKMLKYFENKKLKEQSPNKRSE